MVWIRMATGLAICAGLTGCSITRTVIPIESAQVSQVCVLENRDILMDEFQPEIQRQIEAKQIPTKVYTGTRPQECSHYLEYKANWQWDMGIYLKYAAFLVYDDRGLAGSAFYDARRGGSRLDKYGHTADKIRPLIDELFGSVSVGPVPAPVAVPVQTESATAPSMPDR
ncbi:Sbal_3080 family lipoprotein [Steroidobacter flavus]|uniref:Sbal_3080 family lipoprotein n=1 Tax=Steroidobacter flavus TaxID=1842136 RepID=A0ABV8SWP2_9GAMM